MKPETLSSKQARFSWKGIWIFLKIMKAIVRLDEQNDEYYDKTGEHIPDAIKAEWLKDGSGTAITDWLIHNSHSE